MAAPRGISRQLGPKDSLGKCPHGTPLAMLKTRCPSCYVAHLEGELRDRDKKLEAVEAWRKTHWNLGHPDFQELRRILKGGE